MSKRDAKYFGLRLRKALSMKGLKPVDLARLMGIDDSIVSRWLNGNTNPGDERKELIAAKIGMSLDDIYSLDPAAAQPETGRTMSQMAGLAPVDAKLTEVLERVKSLESTTGLSEDERKLLRFFDESSDIGRTAILNHAEDIAKLHPLVEKKPRDKP